MTIGQVNQHLLGEFVGIYNPAYLALFPVLASRMAFFRWFGYGFITAGLGFRRPNRLRGFYYLFFFVPVGTMPRMAGHVAFMPATLHEAVPR